MGKKFVVIELKKYGRYVTYPVQKLEKINRSEKRMAEIEAKRTTR